MGLNLIRFFHFDKEEDSRWGLETRSREGLALLNKHTSTSIVGARD